MVFYNKKEEVIEVRLTSFGKTLYSKGKLKPAFYAFFDDDVIYDSSYGSAAGDVDSRIRETPRSKAQYTYSTVEDTKLSRTEETTFEDQNIIKTLHPGTKKSILFQDQKRKDSKTPIGTSGNETQYYPAWQSYMLQGEIESSKPYIDMTATDVVINIPQINVKQRTFTSKAINDSDDNSNVYGYVFPDGSSVTLEEGDDSEFLLFLKEKNASSDNKNFTIEVFEIEETENKEYLRPLSFLKPYEVDRIVDGMIIENEKAANPDFNISDNPAMVEYYFDMEIDDEIDPDVIRQALANGRFADLRDLESFANMNQFGNGDGNRMRLGTSASDLYGLSLDEIAKLNKETLDNLQSRSGTQAGLYNEEDKTNECD
tara:strand:- start:7835 stop:8947 length:1113 start_codon:yes stop_codon:yes gene_type:complete